MKKIMNWMMAAILVCDASVFTSCTDGIGNNVSVINEDGSTYTATFEMTKVE